MLLNILLAVPTSNCLLSSSSKKWMKSKETIKFSLRVTTHRIRNTYTQWGTKIHKKFNNNLKIICFFLHHYWSCWCPTFFSLHLFQITRVLTQKVFWCRSIFTWTVKGQHLMNQMDLKKLFFCFCWKKKTMLMFVWWRNIV